MSTEAKDQEEATEVFRETISLLEEHLVDYAVGGGLASDHWIDGADHIADIDLVIREDDAPKILDLMATAGFQISEMEHSWLHKTFKGGVTVDLMFELKNGTRFDDSFREHRKRGNLFGTTAYVIAPEDQISSLAGTVDRETVGQHWFAMIDIMSNNDLEWGYLVKRSHRVPFQMLSVIYFALSRNVPVQKGVIEDLIEITVHNED